MDVMFLDKQVTLITPFSPERRTKLFHRGGWTFFKSTWVSVRCEKGGKGELYGHSMYHRFLCSLLARMQHVDATRCVSPTIHTHRQSTFTISAYTYSLFVFSDICLIIHPLAKEITTWKKRHVLYHVKFHKRRVHKRVSKTGSNAKAQRPYTKVGEERRASIYVHCQRPTERRRQASLFYPLHWWSLRAHSQVIRPGTIPFRLSWTDRLSYFRKEVAFL